jgi:hypothetical protein
MPAGSLVELTVPESVSFTDEAKANAPLCELIGLSVPEILTCTIVERTITWTTIDEIPAFSSVQFMLEKGFNNPISTEPTDTFVMNIYTDSSKAEKLDYQDSDLLLTATVRELESEQAKIVQVPASDGGSGEVSKPTKAVLQLELGIAMPPNTIITVSFPKHNPEAPRSLRRSYFVDDAATACRAVENVDTGLRCAVKPAQPQSIPGAIADQEYDALTITGALPSGTSAGHTLSIEIDSVLNPLSMQKRLFFTTVAVESKGKKYNIEQGQTSFTATSPTSISSVEVTASDRTVQNYAEFTLKFQPDVEIEQGAFVMVQFPQAAQPF